MKKLMTKTIDIVFSVIYQICKAYILWYMYKTEMPGILDVETWLCE